MNGASLVWQLGQSAGMQRRAYWPPHNSPSKQMSDIAALLKSEITRLSKKVIRQHVTPLRTATTSQRRQLAQLRQQVLSLQKEVASLRRNAKSSAVAAGSADGDNNLRFVAKGFKTLRSRLGLSAEDAGLILGVSSQSVFNWENGRAKPRTTQLPAIAALRAMGKREALARLAEISERAKSAKRK